MVVGGWTDGCFASTVGQHGDEDMIGRFISAGLK